MMLMNIFSVFDPTSFFGISLNWLILLIVIMVMPMKYYYFNGGNIGMFMYMMNVVFVMFKEVAMPNYLGITFLCMSTFFYLVLNNILGLFPFIFTSTAHPMVTMGFGFVLWLTFFSFGFMKNFKNSMAHLVPEGSPLILSPFLVIIEIVSHLMRPFTLSIRLAANMMAGHLIVGLLASISLLDFFSFFSSIFLQSVLLVLEFAVSLIQGFVFSILLLLYALEYY